MIFSFFLLLLSQRSNMLFQARTKLCRSLPLHLAARYGAGMDIIQALVNAYPQGLNEKNVHGEKPFVSTYTNEVRVVQEICFYQIASVIP